MKDEMITNDKDWFRSLTVDQLEQLSKILSPEQFMPLLGVKQRIFEEDELRERRIHIRSVK